MATKPKNTTSAEDVAIHAVQEALELDLLDEKLVAAGEPTKANDRIDDDIFEELERKLTDAANDLRAHEERQAVATSSKQSIDATEENFIKQSTPTKVEASETSRKKADGFDSRQFTPANDDRQNTIAELVYGLQLKPSRWPVYLALALAFIWVATTLYYVRISEPALFSTLTDFKTLFAIPKTYFYLGVALIPAAAMLATSVLIRRAQEMRYAARSMTEAAIRLMQPEHIASESVVSVGRAVRREVAAMGDGVERALARAGELESMVQNEVLNLQRSYSDSEIRLRTLIADLGKERETVLGHAEKLRASIAGSHIGLSDELEKAGGRMQLAIDDATNRLSTTLVERQSGITATLSEAGENLVSLLTNSGSDIENRIHTGTSKLSEALASHTSNLTSEINIAGNAVATLMETQSARLEERGSSLTRQFEDAIGIRVSEFSSRISEAGENLQGLLDNRLQGLDKTLSVKGQAFVQALGNRTEALDRVLSDRSAAISDTLKERLSIFGTAMTDHLNEVSQQMSVRQKELEANTSKIGESILSRTTQIESALEQRHSQISQSMSAGLAAIASKAEEFRQSIDSQSSGLLSGVDEKTRTLLANMDARLQNLAVGIEENSASLNELIESKSKNLMLGLNAASDNLALQLETGTGNLHQGVEQRTHSLMTGLNERIASLISNLENQSVGLTSNLDGHVGTIGKTMDQKSIALLAALERRTNSMSSDLDARSASFAGGLEQKVEAIRTILSEKSTGLLAEIDLRTAALSGDLDIQSKGFAGGLEQKVEAIRMTLAEKSSLLISEIEQRTANLSSEIDARSTGFADGLEQKVDAIRTTLDTKSAALLEGLVDGAKALASIVEQKSSELDTILSSNNETLAVTVDSKFGLFSKMLEEKRNAISFDLGERIEQTVGAIDEKAAVISQILTERAAVVNATLGEGLIENQRLLESKTSEFNDMLSSRSSDLSKILDEQARPIIGMLKDQGDETTGKLEAVHSTIHDNVENLLIKLGTIGDSMKTLIGRAGDDLGQMQETITSQANSMADTVARARADVEQSSDIAVSAHLQMDTTASNLLSNIGGIAERFEQQGSMLEHATRLIDNAQRNFSQTLEDREGSLEMLAKGLVERTSEIDRSMASFGEMLTRTMDEMTQRSRLVGNTVASEIGTAIEETSARFSAATDAMRQAAQDVQRDLEDTRTQMRRGVMELPDETRQSADAMRKVVADQIAALRDLSEIVTKSGKALDAAPANAAPIKQFATANVQRSVAPARPQAIPTPVYKPAPSAQMPRAIPTVQPLAEPALSRPAPPRTAFSPSQSPSNGPSGTGWVSDLLRRASSDDEVSYAPRSAAERTPPVNNPNTINSITMDIARLVDHNAQVELWLRYQNGERNVFSRRLYTVAGQQTFDQVRNKYARDLEFSRVVDRYIQDYERLLAEVAQNDRDNTMTTAYLTSDTGKVYTLLAHAAGLFGNV